MTGSDHSETPLLRLGSENFEIHKTPVGTDTETKGQFVPVSETRFDCKDVSGERCLGVCPSIRVRSRTGVLLSRSRELFPAG